MWDIRKMVKLIDNIFFVNILYEENYSNVEYGS